MSFLVSSSISFNVASSDFCFFRGMRFRVTEGRGDTPSGSAVGFSTVRPLTQYPLACV